MDGAFDSQQLKAVLEQAAPVILQSNSEGAIVFASGYYLETLGLQADSLVGSKVVDFIGGEESTRQAFAQALTGELGIAERELGGCLFEIRMSPSIGSSGAIECVNLVFTDITERAKAASELQRSETSFRVLTESSPDAVFVHRFGRIVYANEATRKLLRYASTKELLGRPALELFANEDRGNIASRIREAAMGSESFNSHHKLYRSDGEVATFDMTTMGVQFNGDAAVVHIGRDITQSLRMQKSMAQTERLASLGTLAGGVGHEINNPLAYMTANLSFIAEELRELLPADHSEEYADLHSALQDVRDGTDRVRDIVRQLNDFAKVDDLTEENIDPRAAVETALRMSWNNLRRRACVESELQSVAKVCGNQARLGQVILALLLNASDALSSNTPSEHKLFLRSYMDGADIVLEVKDNGPGIPDEVLSNIFDPFFSASHGTGLGLSVAHSIVVEMGGTIELDTKRGAGTTVQIRLPQSEPTPADVDHSRKILIVTDEVRFLEAAQIALRGHSLRILGRMSLAQAYLNTSEYDAVLCDLSSADVDICSFANKAQSNSSILFFVAQSGTALSEEEKSQGSLLLRKPIGADKIAMELARLWSELPPASQT